MTEPELTLEARALILRFLWKVVIPSGAVLTVLSFLIGFLIQRGAENEAAKEAFKLATKEMVAAVAEIETVKNNAQNLGMEIARTKAEVDDLSNKTRDSLNLLNLDESVAEIAKAVASNPDFLSRVTPLVGRISALEQKSGGTDFKVWFSPSTSGDKNQTISLGKHLMCAVSSARTIHQNQACGCTVTGEAGGQWTLRMTLDEGVRGSKCACQAVCLDPIHT